MPTVRVEGEAGVNHIGHVRIAVLGAGFSGLGLATRLKCAGIDDFVVLERNPDVGGTWHDNTYPNCGCDVPSHLYSFSFALNPNWSRTYSTQPEIWAYLRDCATRFGVVGHVRFRHEVTGAAWDDDNACWRIETSEGTLTARILVGCMGPLSEPQIPAIPGLETFRGTTFHSARWNHEHDLTGRRVASIGTGASAIQYVPAVAREARRLYVFQRTPPWIMPHTDRPITRAERRIYRRIPPLQRAMRGLVYGGREVLVLGFVKNPRLMWLVERLARAHLRRQVPDPELRWKVTPDYTIGCKRILPTNRWYPALGRDNVDLVTESVSEIGPHSIRTTDGVERPVDTIIFGTGFHVTDMPAARWLRGKDGKRLDDVFKGSPRVHLGTTVAGFPNLFLMLGPNTGLGHTSMVYMIESQIAYIVDALRAMDERSARRLEVVGQAQEDFNQWLDAEMRTTVWQTGCASWYLDDTGRNSTLWPDWTFRYRKRTDTLEPAEYEFS